MDAATYFKTERPLGAWELEFCPRGPRTPAPNCGLARKVLSSEEAIVLNALKTSEQKEPRVRAAVLVAAAEQCKIHSVRLTAIVRLGMFLNGHRSFGMSVLPILLRLCEDSSLEVQDAAMRGLAEIDPCWQVSEPEMAEMRRDDPVDEDEWDEKPTSMERRDTYRPTAALKSRTGQSVKTPHGKAKAKRGNGRRGAR